MLEHKGTRCFEAEADGGFLEAVALMSEAQADDELTSDDERGQLGADHLSLMSQVEEADDEEQEMAQFGVLVE